MSSESSTHPIISSHSSSFSEEELSAAELLVSEDQQHVFEHWPEAGVDDGGKARLLAQVRALDKQYPGGLKKYFATARRLLSEAKSGGNPLAGYTPSVPAGTRLSMSEAGFADAEARGVGELRWAAFCLVAGGLGERLGFHGIKISLPSEVTTCVSFMWLYCATILAFQARARALSGDDSIVLPLAVMTSGDTHDRTVQLLEENDNFGMAEGQITLIKQEKVPSLADSEAHVVTDPDDPYQLSTKPHGHGDVHMLLHQSGLARRWADEGRKWLVFFQDTNALVFHAIPAAFGVSAEHDFEVNSLTVPRAPAEAVGAICKLTDSESGKTLTLNVEYNQLDPLLRDTVNPDGDVADPDTGLSPYPGNINVLVFKIAPYADNLDRTNGMIPEFVNPKYKDEAKTEFKKPTRLECMMQDYPKLLDSGARVGFTQCERWMCFAAVKNNVVDAAKKAAKTGFAESACTGEAAIYTFFRRVAHATNRVDINADGLPDQVEFAGVPCTVGARVVVTPRTAVTAAELHTVFGGQVAEAPADKPIKISDNSTLVIDGPGVVIESLDLDGALSIRAVDGAHVTVRGLRVQNDGWALEPVDPNDESVPEPLRIRGYQLVKRGTRELVFDEPGNYVVSE